MRGPATDSRFSALGRRETDRRSQQLTELQALSSRTAGAAGTKMSVKTKRTISVKNESKKCAARFWRFVPHLLLCSSLVAYAVLGALIFQHIEGHTPSAVQEEYHKFLCQMVETVQNLTGERSQNSVCSRSNVSLVNLIMGLVIKQTLYYHCISSITDLLCTGIFSSLFLS